ncbi:SUMF1/EgtB/PvdO family nonheme iron enzyme [Candidatus Villigracilis affinis]|uniref:SUMF1/EgtB/PvdO family nonheme iron enzyme n=1 Tax=Candidatus Villigracilis affinis TaxID=3140682 RepID=UPI001DC96AD1|nr:SUMF1/EgtB/PvdO family nonheme iron enzyme [Anaerolineales bacterium]
MTWFWSMCQKVNLRWGVILIIPNEKPIHQVNLDAFWIDQTEVTNAMYAKCVK